MYQFLCLFGPGAVTCLTVWGLLGESAQKWFQAAIELTAYAALDAAVTIGCLLSRGKAEIIVMPDGTKNIRYGGTAFLFSLAVSFVLGIVIAMIRKRISIRAEVVSRKEEM